MATLIGHTDSKEKLVTIKAVMKALKISFEEDKSTYKAEFMDKIREGEEDIKAGRTKKITLDEIWK
jgi:hypothetical protein